APTACMCCKPVESRAPATSNSRESLSVKVMRRRRRDVPPRDGEGDHPEDGGGGGVPRSDPPPSALRAATSPSWGGSPMTAPFPTSRQEEWRYADLQALKPACEQFAEPLTLTIGAGEIFEEVCL